MTEKERLDLLKLEVPAKGSTVYDPLLGLYLISAEIRIKEEGVLLDLDKNFEDNQLVISYAAWLFKQREEPDKEMPRNIRYELNNRIFKDLFSKSN